MTTSEIMSEVLRQERLSRRWSSSTPIPTSGRRFPFEGIMAGATISPGGKFFLAVFRDFSIQSWDLDRVSAPPCILVPATNVDNPTWVLEWCEIDQYATPSCVDIMTQTMVG